MSLEQFTKGSVLEEIQRKAHPTTADFDHIAQSIASNGAVILRNVIDADFVEELRSNLIACVEEDKETRGEDYLFYGMVHALMIRHKCFRDLLEDPFILGVMRSILGHGTIIHAYNSSSMPPSESNFSRSIHVDSPRLVPNYITNVGLTLALNPFTPDNGAMEIWPGSFQQPSAPSEEEFAANKVKLDNLNPGDAILFNARCWHRGGINSTREWRHAVTMNVCRAYMRQQFDYPKMFSQEQEAQFSEDLKQFLGYFVRSPKSMDEFLLPADQRLYKPGQE